MKKYFITGLVILLPVTLTLIVVVFLFNFLTEPFLGITKSIFQHSGLMDHGFLFLSAEQLQNFISQILILCVLIAFTVCLGAVARWFFIYYLIKLWENVIHKIPFVSSIYKACQDVIKTIFTSKTSAFKQVVMVRFPNPDTWTIGLMTRDSLPGLESSVGSDCILVFVPTTPNPTSGFLTVFKRSDVIPLDMKVEDALKYVISCGVIMTPFKKAQMQPPVVAQDFVVGEDSVFSLKAE
jgi:uncharacterized membrane protein